MAEANPSMDEGYRIPRNPIKILERNAEQAKHEINDKVSSLIESINSQRRDFINKIDTRLAKAKESFKMHGKKTEARLKAKKVLEKELDGDNQLFNKITDDIDEAMDNIEGLLNFKIQWNPKFSRICEDAKSIGELKIYEQSRFEVGCNTPLWSTLSKGEKYNEMNDPKAIVIDPETSNTYVGDASAGRILVINGIGEYLNTLTFKKPGSISSMVIYQDYIYCRSNGFYHNTIFRLDKNTGKLVSRFDNVLPVDAFTVATDSVFFCESYTLSKLSFDLKGSRSTFIEEISPYLMDDSSFVRSMQYVNDEFVMLISCKLPDCNPIQVFDKNGIFLRGISGAIHVVSRSEVFMCIDEHWNIILSSDGLVDVYGKDGKLIKSLGQKRDEKQWLYQPRGIALDTDGNLVVCNNRKHDILQAY